MKRLGIKPDGDELYDEFQKIYDESVDRDTNTEKVEDKMWKVIPLSQFFLIILCVHDFENSKFVIV